MSDLDRAEFGSKLNHLSNYCTVYYPTSDVESCSAGQQKKGLQLLYSQLKQTSLIHLFSNDWTKIEGAMLPGSPEGERRGEDKAPSIV
jgi:hypothetical protein